MQIHTLPMGPLQVNCYVLTTKTEAVCIDPGGSPNPIMAILMSEKVKLTHILLTHLHADHTYGVRPLHFMTEAPVCVCEKDTPLLSIPLGKGGLWGMPEVEPYPYKPIVASEMPMLNTTCSILEVPGHSPGSVSFYFPSEQAVFTGDALFYRSIGRTDLAGGNHETLLRSISTQLMPLPSETTVYPGHGQATSIGDERLNNMLLDE